MPWKSWKCEDDALRRLSNGQVENSETSEILEILFRVFLFLSFRFCSTAKTENSDLKISEKISDISEVSQFSTWTLSNSIDLVSSYAIYHVQSESIFFTKKCAPTTKETETEHTAGHPTDKVMKLNFEKLWKWLDEQTELFTVSKFHAKMCLFAENI